MFRTPFLVGEYKSYPDDSGADIRMPALSPIIAVSGGFLLYSEGLPGKGRPHTKWVATEEHPKDTPGCILQALDEPIMWKGVVYPLFWYAHLSRLAVVVRDGIDAPYRVEKGWMIGRSGYGRSNPHLHCAPLTNRDQAPGHFMPPFEVEKWLKTQTKQHA